MRYEGSALSPASGLPLCLCIGGLCFWGLGLCRSTWAPLSLCGTPCVEGLVGHHQTFCTSHGHLGSSEPHWAALGCQ